MWVEVVVPFYPRCTFAHVNNMDSINKLDRRGRKFTRSFFQIGYPVKILICEMSGLNLNLIKLVILLQEKDDGCCLCLTNYLSSHWIIFINLHHAMELNLLRNNSGTTAA